MSDPAVYNDHREAADVGRRLKELERPYKLAQRVGSRAGRPHRGARRRRPARARPRARGAHGAASGELRLALVPTDPADRKDVIVEVRQGVGGDEAALWAGDVYRMLARYAERRGFKVEELEASPSDGGGFKEVDLRGQGRRRLLRLQVGGRHAPRAARPRDGERRPHPHLDRDRRRDAGGGGGRGRDRPERPQDRRLPLDRPRRAVRQHDRLGRPHHPPADRRRRLDAGREVAASEPGEGDARAARAPLRARARAAARRARRRPQRRRSAPASGPRRSARTTSPRTGSPTTGSS